jgi:hypothetical protein
MERPDNSFERRINQRFDAHLPIDITGAGFEMSVTTKNISCSGIYCQVDRFIPVMTKLELNIVVPLIENQKKVEKQFKCHAIVVRTEPESQREMTDYCSVGLFFTDLSEKDRNLLATYIKQTFLSSNN